MSASTYIVHIHRHCGWYTTKAKGRTFGEAAKRAVIQTCKTFGLDVKEIPHRVSFKHYATYDSVIFYETSARSVFPGPFNPLGITTPGNFWFSEQVRRGKRTDCKKCGGTGECHYNPFLQCAHCGKKNRDGSQKNIDMISIGSTLVRADSSPRLIRAVKREQRAKARRLRAQI